jgi:Zn-dependent protease
VASKGYLTLDPRKYANSMMSVALPLLFLVMGGIGLPGGAVYIQTGRIRSLKMRSLMSLAGPSANIICGLIFGLPFLFGLGRDGHGMFFAGLAFLALLQMFAALLNLLPIPGLDGFGAIQPFLPPGAQRAAMQASRFTFIILFLVVLRMPGVGHALWTGADFLTSIVRVPRWLAADGHGIFQFNSGFGGAQP